MDKNVIKVAINNSIHELDRFITDSCKDKIHSCIDAYVYCFMFDGKLKQVEFVEVSPDKDVVDVEDFRYCGKFDVSRTMSFFRGIVCKNTSIPKYIEKWDPIKINVINFYDDDVYSHVESVKSINVADDLIIESSTSSFYNYYIAEFPGVFDGKNAVVQINCINSPVLDNELLTDKNVYHVVIGKDISVDISHMPRTRFCSGEELPKIIGDICVEELKRKHAPVAPEPEPIKSFCRQSKEINKMRDMINVFDNNYNQLLNYQRKVTESEKTIVELKKTIAKLEDEKVLLFCKNEHQRHDLVKLQAEKLCLQKRLDTAKLIITSS
jgi:hypothetical protein